MPWYFAVFLLISLSSIAVPGFNGFVGEFLILIGSWTFSPWLVVVASLGVILAAGYVLWMVKRVFYGESTNPKNDGLADLSAREAFVLVPLRGARPVHGRREPAVHAEDRAGGGRAGAPGAGRRPSRSAPRRRRSRHCATPARSAACGSAPRRPARTRHPAR